MIKETLLVILTLLLCDMSYCLSYRIFGNVIQIMPDSENIVSDGEFFGNTFDTPKEGVE